MNKESDDLRSYLGFFFDGNGAQKEKKSQEEKNKLAHGAHSGVSVKAYDSEKAASDASLSAEELFRQGAQAAREERRRREAVKLQKQAEEANVWLQNSVRDDSEDSAQGFDFLDEENENTLPSPDEWPAFEDIDSSVAQAEKDREADESAEASDSPAQSEDAKASNNRRSRGFLGRFVGAIVVLGLAVVSAYGISRGHAHTQKINAPVFQGTPISAQLACTGAFERSLDAGMNVGDVDERVRDTAFLLATGTAVNGKNRVTVPADTQDALGIVDVKQAVGLFKAHNNSTALAGLNFHRAEAGDMRGIAGAACANSQVDTYLIGSEISVGTSNELVLVNLSLTPATVHLDALGAAGPLEASTIEDVVVDAQAVKRVPLDGAIDGDKRLALHVSAPTGTVAAFIQETVLEGAKPAGVSWISPSSAASRLVIPAVSIPLDSVDFPRVRVANFEDEPASVSVVLRSDKGTVERDELKNIDISPHSVLDIPLEGIDNGTYSAVITSTIPISAGVELMHRTDEESPREIAWAGAVSPAYEAMGLVSGVSATLALASQESGTVDIALYDKNGKLIKKTEANMSARQSFVLDFPAEVAAVRISGETPVSGAIFGQVSLDDGVGVDWVPLVSRADDESNQRISVW